MKRTQRILEQDEYPICVTVDMDPDDPDLDSWEDYLRKKKNRFIQRESKKHPGRVYLCRAVRPEELAEIKAKRYIIRGGGFKIYPEEA